MLSKILMVSVIRNAAPTALVSPLTATYKPPVESLQITRTSKMNHDRGVFFSFFLKFQTLQTTAYKNFCVFKTSKCAEIFWSTHVRA